jgi:hypothetical protein
MAGPQALETRSPGTERRRLSLLVKVAASAGDFSPKLAVAVDHAKDAEVRVMSDLVQRGMTIPDLVGLLQGAHVLVGDDDLYERWIFPTSRRRMSSHHRAVDKKTTSDYGLDGPLVRESLHGKAEVGTWVQLERTKATVQWGKLPTWSDAVHIRDYVRLSKYSVGGIADVVAERLIDGRAKIPEGGEVPVPISEAELRRVADVAPARWQLIHRVPRRETGTRLVIESMVLRTGDSRVDLVTRTAQDDGYQRVAADTGALREYLWGLFLVR